MHAYIESEIRHLIHGGGFRWYAVDRDGFLATLYVFLDENNTDTLPIGRVTHDALNLASGYFQRLVNPHAGLYWYELKGDTYRRAHLPEGVPLKLDRLPEPVRSAVENLALPVLFQEEMEFPGKLASRRSGNVTSPLYSREENNRRWQTFCDEFHLEMKPSDQGEYWLYESNKAHYPGGIVTGGFCPDCWEKHGDFSLLHYRQEDRDDFLVEIAGCPFCQTEIVLPGKDLPTLFLSDEPVDERHFRR